MTPTYTDFLRNVKKWADNLCKMIEDIKSRGMEPILIALSRKMPRFIDWVIETKADSILSDYTVKTIEKTELTTELALPFLLFQSSSKAEREFIIVDDIIIHGTTIKSVVKDIFLLAGDRYHLSCLFRLEPTELISYIGVFEFVRITPVSESEADTYIDMISDIVENTQLPIDMEFPILELSAHRGLSFNVLEEELKHVGLNNYAVGDDNNRYSIDLPDPQAVGRNNDFAKIRFFRKGKEDSIIEIIAPHLISNQALLTTSIDKRLFKDNGFFQAIWERATLKIRHDLSQPKNGYEGQWEDMKSNFTRSLCVFANYLYSLSIFSLYGNLIDNGFCKQPFKGARLSKKDLELILSADLSDIIYPLLENICESGDFFRSMMDSVLNLPHKFSPSAYSNDWERNTIISCLTADSAKKALSRIFNYQHYSNPKFKNPYLNKERLFFGETFASLIKTIKSYFPRIDASVSVNAWIDENIDGGYVVPKYEKVKSSDGVVYWRRYFHSGIRKRSA